MRYFVVCVKRVRGTRYEPVGISELGIAETPEGSPIVYKTKQEVIDGIHGDRHEYLSPAKDDPTNERRWARVTFGWQGSGEILKTEFVYDEQVHLSKKPTCRHS